MNIDLFGNEQEYKFNLADKYLFAPTSILNRRDPKWHALRRKWINMGIKSELGRNTANGYTFDDFSDTYKTNYKSYTGLGTDTATSVFDPVLCEIFYKWYTKEGDNILDPFAGGSVRGIVANKLKRKYTGIELRSEQVQANREQAINILPVRNQPQWIDGDSDIVLNDEFNIEYDLIFTCPPYMNLEIYSNNPNDLSNMNDIDFINKYESIIGKSCKLLKKGGFAIYVVGDLRDSKGYQKDFTGITKQAMFKYGMKLWNEIIMIDPVGTKAMTMERAFVKSGKVAKVHQNIYVFIKP